MYFAGGPGESSIYSVASKGGLCTVLNDSTTTEESVWSYNQYSNILWIDQPVAAGFSYNSLLQSTNDWLFLGDPNEPLRTSTTAFVDYDGHMPAENVTFTYGVLPSQDPKMSTQTTVRAARVLWNFSQVWFAGFPEYKTNDKRIILWANSQGGLWCTITGAHFIKQNKKVADGRLEGLELPLDTVGFTNGFVDALSQLEWYPEFA